MIPVCQCWDDGVVSDIRLTEILRRYGVPATFNLCPGTHSSSRTSGWKFRGEFPVWKLAADELVSVYDGFDIANHSWSHQRLPAISSDEAAREIYEGRDALERIFDRKIAGFVYPFGDLSPGIAAIVAEAGHTYARTTGGGAEISPADPVSILPSAHFLSPCFWEELEACKACGKPFYFWGHSYELVSETMWEDFEKTIHRIGQDPGVEWAHVSEVAPLLKI